MKGAEVDVKTHQEGCALPDDHAGLCKGPAVFDNVFTETEQGLIAAFIGVPVEKVKAVGYFAWTKERTGSVVDA